MVFLGCQELPLKSEVIHSVIEIITDDHLYDLHNAGEYLGFSHDVQSQIIELNWFYYNMEGHPDKLIKIVCKDVLSFSIKERDSEMPHSEDDCLSEIIYDNKSVTFIFWGGQEININCKEFDFIVRKREP